MSFAASKTLRQIRVAMCQTGAGSTGVRCAAARSPRRSACAVGLDTQFLPPRSDFWAKNYASIKAANSKIPILLRESSGCEAKLTATYGAVWAAPSAATLLTPPLLSSYGMAPQSLAWRNPSRWKGWARTPSARSSRR